MEVVEAELEIDKVFFVLCLHFRDQCFRCCAGVSGAHHDRRAVRIVSPDPGHVVAAQTLKSRPDISLDVLDHMANVD